MKKSFLSALLLVMMFVVAGCASGPKFAEIESTIPKTDATQGRVYFFRSNSLFGAAIQPSIMLNGNKVGDSMPGGFFFVDAAPGNYEVATSSEVERKLTFTLEKGQTRYVRTSIGIGLLVGRVYPELVNDDEGDREVRGLKFTGTVPSKK